LSNDSPTGHDRAPDRYSGQGRETIDRMRDLAHEMFTNPKAADEAFAFHCIATALKYAALWCGVRIISETLASLPCILYRRRGTDKERATDDPRYSLVHGSPSDELDSYHFFEVSTAHMVLWGNSYAKIVRSGLNMPLELDLRLPDRTRPARRKSDGQLIYECTDPRETIEAPDMLHGVGFSFDGIDGYSLVKMAAQSLGISIAADKYAGSSLKNGAVPSGVLSHPAKLDKPAREQTRSLQQ